MKLFTLSIVALEGEEKAKATHFCVVVVMSCVGGRVSGVTALNVEPQTLPLSPKFQRWIPSGFCF